jgi:hypothetical protein
MATVVDPETGHLSSILQVSLQPGYILLKFWLHYSSKMSWLSDKKLFVNLSWVEINLLNFQQGGVRIPENHGTGSTGV